MALPTAPLARKQRGLFTAAAALSAGVLLGARGRQSPAMRIALTIGAAAMAGLALAQPSGDALRRTGKRRRTGQVRISLEVPRPVEQVFALCADFETFPRLLPNVQKVTDYGDGRAHWWATSPAGDTIEWDTLINKFVTNSVIGWRSVPNSPVQVNGTMRFSPEGTGTCLRIAVDFTVQSSSLRDSIAALLSPRNGPRLEKQIRALSWRLADAEGITTALPPLVPGDAVTTG